MTANKEAQIKRLADEIRGIKTAMFTTIGVDGFFRSRPMISQKTDFDGTLNFFTHIYDDKVKEIQNDNRICVSFSSPSENKWVSVSGTAEIIRERDIMDKEWNPELKKWFPHETNDPDLALIKVTAHKGEYWESNQGIMVQLFEYMVGISQNKNYKVSSHENIDLDK